MDGYEIVENNLNAICVDISNIKGISKVRVIGVYRPPDRRNYNEMIAVMESLWGMGR